MTNSKTELILQQLKDWKTEIDGIKTDLEELQTKDNAVNSIIGRLTTLQNQLSSAVEVYKNMPSPSTTNLNRDERPTPK